MLALVITGEPWKQSQLTLSRWYIKHDTFHTHVYRLSFLQYKAVYKFIKTEGM